MDALLKRWIDSEKNPQYLFPGNQFDIITLLQAWVTRRKQNHAELMAHRTNLHALAEAALASEQPTLDLSMAQKRRLASETLELISQTNALDSTQAHETLLATYLLATLASLKLRLPNSDPQIRVEEAVCSYLARVLPAFGRDRELSLLVDREGEARLKAKQIEIAERIREKMGIDVFVDTELRVTAFEKMLVEFVKSGQWGDGSGQDE